MSLNEINHKYLRVAGKVADSKNSPRAKQRQRRQDWAERSESNKASEAESTKSKPAAGHPKGWARNIHDDTFAAYVKGKKFPLGDKHYAFSTIVKKDPEHATKIRSAWLRKHKKLSGAVLEHHDSLGKARSEKSKAAHKGNRAQAMKELRAHAPGTKLSDVTKRAPIKLDPKNPNLDPVQRKVVQKARDKEKAPAKKRPTQDKPAGPNNLDSWKHAGGDPKSGGGAYSYDAGHGTYNVNLPKTGFKKKVPLHYTPKGGKPVKVSGGNWSLEDAANAATNHHEKMVSGTKAPAKKTIRTPKYPSGQGGSQGPTPGGASKAPAGKPLWSSKTPAGSYSIHRSKKPSIKGGERSDYSLHHTAPDGTITQIGKDKNMGNPGEHTKSMKALKDRAAKHRATKEGPAKKSLSGNDLTKDSGQPGKVKPGSGKAQLARIKARQNRNKTWLSKK